MRLLLNSMGDEHCRPAYREKVAALIRVARSRPVRGVQPSRGHQPAARVRLQEPGMRDVMAAAPLLRDELCDECAEHYAQVKRYLDALGIAYVEEPAGARARLLHPHGLRGQADAGLGAQNAIGGGGRYDRLMEEYGGPADARPWLGARLRAHAARAAGCGRGVPAPARRRGVRRARR